MSRQWTETFNLICSLLHDDVIIREVEEQPPLIHMTGQQYL